MKTAQVEAVESNPVSMKPIDTVFYIEGHGKVLDTILQQGKAVKEFILHYKDRNDKWGNPFTLHCCHNGRKKQLFPVGTVADYN